jgi:hypothetical protein
MDSAELPKQFEKQRIGAEDVCRLETRCDRMIEKKPKRSRMTEGQNRGAIMTRTVHGTVHGRMIELDEDLGVVEGQHVEVQLTIVESAKKWGEGIRNTAGALADDPDWDGIMEEIYQARKVERRVQTEDE